MTAAASGTIREHAHALLRGRAGASLVPHVWAHDVT
jgi:hypothetical protein